MYTVRGAHSCAAWLLVHSETTQQTDLTPAGKMSERMRKISVVNINAGGANANEKKELEKSMRMHFNASSQPLPAAFNQPLRPSISR